MSESKLNHANEKIKNTVVSGYKKIEEGVVDGYKKIENGVVGGYKKMEEGVVSGLKRSATALSRSFSLARTKAWRKPSSAWRGRRRTEE